MNAAALDPALSDPTMWPLIVPAVAFMAIGASCIAWPRPILKFYHAVLNKMRVLPGRRLVEWEMGQLETRGAVIFTRAAGALFVLGGLSILFVYGMARAG